MDGDVYVFAQSWQPEFCYNKTDYVGCQQPLDSWNKYFTIHGLWPQYSTGGYPANCTPEPLNTTAIDEVGFNTMVTYWPNAQYATTDPNYYSFWDHEWTKHGTCTGLSQVDYFQGALDLLQSFGTPSLITNNAGGSVDAATLRAAYGGPTMASLQCTAGSFINGVYSCWSTANGKVSGRISCPDDVQKEDTCTATTVLISTFPTSKKN